MKEIRQLKRAWLKTFARAYAREFFLLLAPPLRIILDPPLYALKTVSKDASLSSFSTSGFLFMDLGLATYIVRLHLDY